MAYWVEVHCDILSEGPRDPKRLHTWCASNRNDHPGALGVSAQKAARAAEGDARRQGWKKRGKEWACPNCWKELIEQARVRNIAAARARAAQLDTKSVPAPAESS
jgi:hypothetical protein